MKLALLFLALSSTTCFGQSLYDYYVSSATEQLQSGNYERAAYFLDKGVNMYPDSVNLYIIRSYNWHYLELPDSSIADLKRAKELGSKNALVPMFLGLNYQDISEFELATVHYKEYLELVPEDSNIVISLVTLLVDQGELSEAEQYTSDYKEAYPNSHSSSMLLGLVNHGRESYQKAIEHFTDYIKRSNGRDPYGYLHRSYSYKELGMLTEMCEDIWSIRHNFETSGSKVYFEEGCEKILNRANLPPPEERIISVPPPAEDK